MSAKRILNVAKKVFREAASVGIEEAGIRLCGPTGWKFIRKAIDPVIEELERRFPDFLMVPDELEAVEEALDNDDVFETLVLNQLATIKEGSIEILRVLARQDEVIKENNTIITRAFEEAKEQGRAAHEQIMSEFAKNSMRDEQLLAEIRSLRAGAFGQVRTEYSDDELYYKANAFQHDAMKWISASDAQTASERVASGRALAEEGLRRLPANAKFLVTFGFLEKTAGQISILNNDVDQATDRFGNALVYFRRAGALDPNNLDALNGMANVYTYQGDYKRAVDLGLSIFRADPTHGPAALDLSIALEKMIAEAGQDSEVGIAALNLVSHVYKALEQIMPQQPTLFPASYLADVQRRRKEVEALIAMVASHSGAC